MTTLPVLIDYDNVQASLRSAGPVALVRAVVLKIPAAIISQYTEVHARLYGGWRSKGGLTVSAQKLIPDIRVGSPSIMGLFGGGSVRIIVELADRMVGAARAFEETYVKERPLRPFRITQKVWTECVHVGASCGFAGFMSLGLDTSCVANGCSNTLGHILVRDEQKMVDTMIVADIAYHSLQRKVPDIMIVSSDTDMWPGVLLAVQAGCKVLHLHTVAGWKTQTHLIGTLNSQSANNYNQISF